MVRATEAIAGNIPGLTGAFASAIPIGRGLGSSAAVISAGLLLGCALAGRDPDPAELLRIGLRIEGHPDNLAACLYGGIVLVAGDEVVRLEPAGAIRPAILVPDGRLSTQEARKALPASVPLQDAVFTASRTSGLVALLTGVVEPTPGRLLAFTEDVLHQPYRAPLMLQTADVVASLRANGTAAVVSGAGPSILCLLLGDTPAPSVDGWTTMDLAWEPRGARMTVTG